MMADDTRLDRIEARQRDFDERLLAVEMLLGRPMSIVDLAIAAETAKRRYEARFLGVGVLEPDCRDQRGT
jgi:hypothetical protein